MAAILLFAAALTAAPVAQPATSGSPVESASVAYEELANNRVEAAIEQILASGQIEDRDPAALINLGAAYARIGKRDRALAMYRSAITSPIRYDLQLADGRWMDSRAAARLAASALEKETRIVLR